MFLQLLYRKGPSGQLLQTKSDKTCVENKNCLSELIVTNVQLPDSGAYTLATYTGAESKEIKVTLFVEGDVIISYICVT